MIDDDQDENEIRERIEELELLQEALQQMTETLELYLPIKRSLH
jgi:hypothetical protein